MPWINGLIGKLRAASVAHHPPEFWTDVQTGQDYGASCIYDAASGEWRLRINLHDETVAVDYGDKDDPDPGSLRRPVRRNPRGQ